MPLTVDLNFQFGKMTDDYSFKLALFVFVNGVYDMVCAFSVLECFSRIHTDVFVVLFERNDETGLLKRLLAYWISTYGMIRLAWSISIFWEIEKRDDMQLRLLCAVSYYIEAICYENEFGKGTVHGWKAHFICFTCFIIGTCLGMSGILSSV